MLLITACIRPIVTYVRVQHVGELEQYIPICDKGLI